MEHSLPRGQFIWSQPDSTGRNCFALFARDVDISGTVLTAPLRLFADTRYRLWVNGSIVGHGPARFFPPHPEFDTFDLAPLLAQGKNRLLVEVWSAGCNNFQSVPSRGGFWAEGSVTTAAGEVTSLHTAGAWSALASNARQSQSIPLSFALGPVEVLDLGRWREEVATVAQKPVPVAGHLPWGPPQPRSIPAFRAKIRQPARLLYWGTGDDNGEERLSSFTCYASRRDEYGHEQWRGRHVVYWTRVYSPRAQRVKVGLFWGTHVVNGVTLQPETDESRGNRQVAWVELQAGWNRWAGEYVPFLETWGMILGLPREAGLRLAADGEAGKCRFYLSRLLDKAEYARVSLAALTEPEVTALPEWMLPITISHDAENMPPARAVAWDGVVNPQEPRPYDGQKPLELQADENGLIMGTWDMGGEFLGHVRLRWECSSDGVVDVANDEFLRPDGTLKLYQGHFLANTADRFRFAAGSHEIEGFHNRGGRYLQANFRLAPRARLTLHRIEVLENKTPAGQVGTFECDAPFWNWAWQTSLATLEASLEDVWSDSPWREQGCYLGDSLVQFHAHGCLSNDFAIPRRILRLWAQGQLPDGQLPSVVPSWMERPHPDFTLLYTVFVRDYWARTGEVELVRELLPCLQRILESPAWLETERGLIHTQAGPLFIDWAVEREARLGESSVLNALWIRAHQVVAELAQACGEEHLAQVYCARAERALAAFRRELWDEERGHFITTLLPDGTRHLGRALHANALAWAWNLGSEEQNARVLPHLLRELEGNGGKTVEHMRHQPPGNKATLSGQLEPYFLFYLLDPLVERGHAAFAEALMEETWGIMQREGAWTFWESIGESYFRRASWCHSWAVAPMIHAMRRMAGISFPVPGDLSQVCIQPETVQVKRVKAVAPHPAGNIEIAWQREGQVLRLHVRHPAAVTVVVPAHCRGDAGIAIQSHIEAI